MTATWTCTWPLYGREKALKDVGEYLDTDDEGNKSEDVELAKKIIMPLVEAYDNFYERVLVAFLVAPTLSNSKVPAELRLPY